MGISPRESRTVFSPRSGPADRKNSLDPIAQGVVTTESSRDLPPGKVLPWDSGLPYWYFIDLRARLLVSPHLKPPIVSVLDN